LSLERSFFLGSVSSKPTLVQKLLFKLRKQEQLGKNMKIYVGNLSFNTSNEDLQKLFSQAGTVESVSVIEDRETGRSRGFGFVEMASKEAGEAAIAQFNETQFDGRSLRVNEAKPREPRSGFGGGNGRNSQGASRNSFASSRGRNSGSNFGNSDRNPRW
jgi:cold-inducible RNA-binding protein